MKCTTHSTWPGYGETPCLPDLDSLLSNSPATIVHAHRPVRVTAPYCSSPSELAEQIAAPTGRTLSCTGSGEREPRRVRMEASGSGDTSRRISQPGPPSPAGAQHGSPKTTRIPIDGRGPSHGSNNVGPVTMSHPESRSRCGRAPKAPSAKAAVHRTNRHGCGRRRRRSTRIPHVRCAYRVVLLDSSRDADGARRRRPSSLVPRDRVDQRPMS